MSTVVAKDWALVVGSQLASIESQIGQIAGMVMQAAIHDQIGVANTAQLGVDALAAQVEVLSDNVAEFRKALRS